MQSIKKWLLVFVLMFSLPVHAQQFLSSPLACGDPSCNFPYSQGVYTPGIMNSVLDHAMAQNPNGKFPYKDPYSNAGLNGVVEAFNGEVAAGPTYFGDVVCV